MESVQLSKLSLKVNTHLLKSLPYIWKKFTLHKPGRSGYVRSNKQHQTSVHVHKMAHCSKVKFLSCDTIHTTDHNNHNNFHQLISGKNLFS